MNYKNNKKLIFQYASPKLLWVTSIVAIVYILWWFDIRNIGNPYLYALLFAGEIYHIFMALAFWFTVYPKKNHESGIMNQEVKNNNLSVDIFIPVVSEPLHVIEETVRAAKNIEYENKRVHILNDGFVAKRPSSTRASEGKPGWKEVEELGSRLGANVITRKIPGGAKAGNINNALRETSGDVVVIFDADMVAHWNFLNRLMPFFEDPKMAFVQTPQYYKNFKETAVTEAAWEQQHFFFGPIMVGKDRDNAAFICGTNVAIRRKALVEAGGMSEDSIAEDFLTSIKIHKLGYKSKYINEVLAEGLAPHNLQAYYKQQQRWTRGSLDVLVTANPLFQRGLTWRQKIHYLSSALYYVNGVVVLIDIIMPLIFLYTGVEPIKATTYYFAIFFLPYMFMVLYTLYYISQGYLTLRAISFSYSLWLMQIVAVVMTLIRINIPFKVTPKESSEGNFLHLAIPHILYFLAILGGLYFVFQREVFISSVATNMAWVIFNLVMFYPFVANSFNWRGMFNIFKLPTFISSENSAGFKRLAA